MKNYIQVLKKYATFSGRSQRKEFWMFYFFNALIGIFLAIMDTALDSVVGGTIVLLYSLAVAIPIIAVSVRRLHDTNRSGW